MLPVASPVIFCSRTGVAFWEIVNRFPVKSIRTQTNLIVWEACLSMLDNAEICPVVFEMLERLKQDSDYEEFNESYVEEFREMTRRFKEHAPSGMMSAEEWFAWQKSDNALANRTNQQ